MVRAFLSLLILTTGGSTRADSAPVGLSAKAAALDRRCVAGDANACADEGLEVADANRQVALYKKGCDLGSAPGCGRLGVMVRDGTGVIKDLARAVALLGKSCQGGYARGCQHLGSLYANGRPGFAINLERAFFFHEKACDGGFADGCMSVGYMYEHGEHVAIDLKRAAALYRSACDAGSGDGCYGSVLLLRDGKVGKGTLSEMSRLMRKGCELKGAFACEEFAHAFVGADGMAREGSECCLYGALLRSCAANHQSACLQLGFVCSTDGVGEAIEKYQRLCTQEAQYKGCEFLRGDRYNRANAP